MTLSERAARFVQAQVESGAYPTPEAAVEAALGEAEAEAAYWAEMREKIAEAEASIARDGLLDAYEALDELKKKLGFESLVAQAS